MLAQLFLYGTLLDPATLAERSGRAELPKRLVLATLDGWQRVAKRGGRYPTLRRQRGSRVNGALLTVPANALARLSTYEGSAYRLMRVVVTTDKGKTAAHAWIAADATRRSWKE
jgi:gamma-glutamylcyclotransferase (GGCT)/AIG2-like uncharacterized protein YtfP